MKLIAYAFPRQPLSIRPAPVEREWMDNTQDRFAYRCLPLNIANAHGWEILNPTGFQCVWDGKDSLDAIKVVTDRGDPAPAISHFGAGVLTFHIMCLFRTEPGYDLYVTGPVNNPKDAIYALSGIIETDWAPYTFTMNWRFTRPGKVVRFDAGEPFIHFFPMKRGEIEAFEPTATSIENEPELRDALAKWEESRNKFNHDLSIPDSEARKQAWQKLYYHGLDAAGQKVKAVDHKTRVKLKAFTKV